MGALSDRAPLGPQCVKDLYTRQRAAALRMAGEVLEIVARRQTSAIEPRKEDQ